MKYYYTLGQPFSGNERDLSHYFNALSIEYKMGGDFENEHSDKFLRTYYVLLDNEDLLAIQLSLDNVKVLDSHIYQKVVNRLRKTFSWFL